MLVLRPVTAVAAAAVGAHSGAKRRRKLSTSASLIVASSELRAVAVWLNVRQGWVDVRGGFTRHSVRSTALP